MSLYKIVTRYLSEHEYDKIHASTNYDSVRLVHFRSINVNKNLGQNEKIFWIFWLRQVRLI